MKRCLWRVLWVLPLALAHAAVAATTSAVDEAISAAEYSHALTLIDAQLVDAPDDYALRFRRAQVNRYLGKHAAALRDLDRLRREYPDDVDYALARARSLAALGKTAEALDESRAAAALAPDYEEAWEFRHGLLRQQRDPARIAELEQLTREARNRFPQSTWWREVDEERPVTWSVLIGSGYDNLDNGNPSWHQQFIELSRAHATAGNYRLGLVRDERYGESDLTVRVSGDRTLPANWFGAFEVSAAGNARFQADVGYSIALGRALGEGWVSSLEYRRREYASVAVGSFSGTVEKYFGNFRTAYRMTFSRLQGASNSLGHAATVNWYMDDRTSFGISVGAGEEAEVISPGQVLETDVRSLTLSGTRQISERYGLRWWLGLHEQGDFYRRRSLGLAVSIQL